MTLDEIIEKIKVPVIKGSYMLNSVLIVLLYTGIFTVNVIYVKTFNTFIQLIICLFLIYRFNPFVKHELRKQDSSIIFACAILLLTNLGITQYYMYRIQDTLNTGVKNGVHIVENGLSSIMEDHLLL